MADRRDTPNRLLRVGRFMLAAATYLALLLPALLSVYIKLDLDRYGTATLDWGEGAWEVLFVTVLFAAGIITLAWLARRRLERARDDDGRLRVVCTAGGALAGAFAVSIPFLRDALLSSDTRIVLLVMPFAFALWQAAGAGIGALLGGFPWLFGSRRRGVGPGNTTADRG